MNVLRAARDAGVKRLVLTSSVAALGRAQPGDPPRDESYWNQNTFDPYPQAKALGEKQAHAFAEEHGLPSIAILPSVIPGSGFHRPSPSVRTLMMLIQGRMPFIPPPSISYVDVRDLARAHLLACENEQANGRYIVSGDFMSVADVVALAKAIDPAINAPTRTVPKPCWAFCRPWNGWAACAPGPSVLSAAPSCGNIPGAKTAT